MSKKSLGIDLGTLLSDTTTMYQDSLDMFMDEDNLIYDLKIDEINTNPYQPRKEFDENSIIELANSISEYGLLQPITVIDLNSSECKIDKKYKYIIIAGERRFRACKYLQHLTIKSRILKIDFKKIKELALIENIQRKNLNILELAFAYKQIIDEENITQEELASRLKIKRASIANTLRILKLSERVQKLIACDKISFGHAKIIVSNKEFENELTDAIIKLKLNVRETEQFLLKLKSNQKNSKEELIDVLKLKKYNISFKIKNNKILFDLNDKFTLDFINKLINNI